MQLYAILKLEFRLSGDKQQQQQKQTSPQTTHALLSLRTNQRSSASGQARSPFLLQPCNDCTGLLVLVAVSVRPRNYQLITSVVEQKTIVNSIDGDGAINSLTLTLFRHQPSHNYLIN